MARAKKTTTCYMPFPTRLRELLDTPGETQEKLANAIGAKRQSIGQWKEGITSPDINALKKIADYYNVSTDYLLGRIDIKSPDIDNMAIHKKTGLSDEAISILYKKNIASYAIFNIDNKIMHRPIKNSEQLQDIENSGGNIIAAIEYNFIKTVDILIRNPNIVDYISEFLFSDFVNADNSKNCINIRKRGENNIYIPVSLEEINRVYLLRAEKELIDLKERLKKEVE